MSEKETFEDFKNSFFYGSRSDMSFKFLEHMPEEKAALFLQDFFRTVIDGLDTNDLATIRSALVGGQIQGYEVQKHFDYAEGPFTAFEKELKDTTLTLITSSGHFVEGHDPMPFGIEDMSQEDAEQRIFDSLKEEPVLSEIPFSTPAEKLRVRHGGYDIRAAKIDANVTFPWQRLVELKEQNIIGGLTESAFSFVGACSQKRLLNQTLPLWVEKIKNTGAEAVLLVPV